MYQDISQVLSDFLTGFQRNPMDAQETTELHKQLFSALYRQFASAGVRHELDRAGAGMTFQPERKQVRINPVRTAYPPKEKFDVVVIDVESASDQKPSSTQETSKAGESQPETAPDTYQVYWQQPLSFALNLHLCMEEDQVGKYLKALGKDLRKMAAYWEQLAEANKFVGITLLLVDAYLEEEPGTEINWDLQPGLSAWVVTPDRTYLYTPA